MANDEFHANDERKFLHELSTPLGAALLFMDSVLEDIQNRSSTDPDDLMRLTEINKALNKINTLLTERRETLIKRGIPSGRS